MDPVSISTWNGSSQDELCLLIPCLTDCITGRKKTSVRQAQTVDEVVQVDMLDSSQCQLSVRSKTSSSVIKQRDQACAPIISWVLDQDDMCHNVSSHVRRRRTDNLNLIWRSWLQKLMPDMSNLRECWQVRKSLDP